MTTYNSQTIENTIRNAAVVRIAKKRTGSEYQGDAGYWDGGRCEYGGAHNLQEDCRTLATFFGDISKLKNARKDLTKFNNEQEFNRTKQNLINEAQRAISGLQMGSGSTTSVGGTCIIWDDFAEQLEQIINDFRRDVENLKNDIERVPYNEAKELQKLTQEENKLKKEIEENERKARSENDPEKRKRFIILANEAKEKWKKVLERKKQLKSSNLGDSFEPEKHINDFIKRIEDNLKNRPSRPPRDPRFPNPNQPNIPNPNFPNSPNDPFNPFQTTNTTSSDWFQKNKTLIILAGAVLLIILYFSSSSDEPEPVKKPNFYDYDF